MKDLIDALKLNLYECELFDIDEGKLLSLKNYDYFIKNKFYFFLINKLHYYEEEKMIKELAYCHYLISYFLFIILTPLEYEGLSFYHIKKAVELDNNIHYKEWYLIFSTLPIPYIKTCDAIKIAEEVIKNNSESNIAKVILSMY